MMRSPLRFSAAAVATIGLLASAACSSSDGSSPKSSDSSAPSSSTTAATTSSTTATTTAAASSGGAPTSDDLTATLIGGGDIPADTFTLHDASPLPGNGTSGIAGTFANADASRTVSDILVWYPSASAASTAIAASQQAVAGEITGSLTDASLAVGTNGHVYTGTTSRGLAALALFQQGNYVVTMEFDSKAGDAIPVALVTQVAQAQNSKVKAAS